MGMCPFHPTGRYAHSVAEGALATTLLEFSRMAHLMEFMHSAPHIARTRDQQNQAQSLKIQGLPTVPGFSSGDSEAFWSRSPPRRGMSNALLQMSPCNAALTRGGKGRSIKTSKGKAQPCRGKQKKQKNQRPKQQQPQAIVKRKKKRRNVTFVLGGNKMAPKRMKHDMGLCTGSRP